jgi:putative Holliday junction resolvase
LKLLGLDIGNRRIGLAVSDPRGTFAIPTGYLDRNKLQSDINQILEFARSRNAEGIVVGIPYTVSGELGYQAKQVEGFIRALNRSTNLPVHRVDERFTSFEAEGLLKEAGQQPSRHKGSVDSAAATLILERFLNKIQ